MAPLTYLEFHLLFVLPPIVILGFLAYVRGGTWWGKRPLSGIGILVVLALLYTTPWDNLLIAAGVWEYGDDTTLVHFWRAPLGEYLFFVLQPVLTGFWLSQFPQTRRMSLRIAGRNRILGVMAGLAVSAVGLVLVGSQPTLYLGAILLWAGPILAIQWAFGWPYLWAVRRSVGVAFLVPTLYCWLIDRIALELGIWTISSAHTIGIGLFGLPIEEATFFFMTNLFIVQGVVLYMWLLDRVEAGALDSWRTTLSQRFSDVDA